MYKRFFEMQGVNVPLFLYLCSMRRFRYCLLFMVLALMPGVPALAQYSCGNGWSQYVPDPSASSRPVFVADEVLRLVPPVAGLTLGALGVPAEHPFRERVAVMATSGAVVVGSVYALKYFVQRERPYAQGMDSFPSGHAAIAFWGAEIVREEYGWGWGAGAYAVATGVAVLRLCHQQHWETDVLAGAAIGVMGARLGYLLLPWECRVFGWDAASPTVVTPSYDPYLGALQLTLSKSF